MLSSSKDTSSQIDTISKGRTREESEMEDIISVAASDNEDRLKELQR